MTLTLAIEMLTNEGHEVFDKQDCELKSFCRLVPKLHRLFPRTPLVLLLDSLYANQNAIRLIESFRWMYVVNVKEGSMPERFAEAMALMALQPQNAPQTLPQTLHKRCHKRCHKRLTVPAHGYSILRVGSGGR